MSSDTKHAVWLVTNSPTCPDEQVFTSYRSALAYAKRKAGVNGPYMTSAVICDLATGKEVTVRYDGAVVVK